MDLRAMKLKHLKKASKWEKRKYVTLWKTFGIFFLVLTLLLAPLCVAVKVADNALTAWLGGSLWKLENRDENAQYFKPDQLNARELTHQVALEGITLLRNEDNALPLQSGAKISYFGKDGNLKTALESEGFTVNEQMGSASAYGDAAVVSVPLANTELLQNLADLKKSGSLQKIILLLQGKLPLSFVKDNPYGVDGMLWIGEPGADGMQAVAELLSGKVNPSGSLPNTLTFYTASAAGDCAGYRYFETQYGDKMINSESAGAYSYENQVAYPFGYGLSYTSFAYSDFAVTYDEKTDKFAVTVTVTNTGKVPGKESVQVYGQSIYTDNGVEKPTVTLVGFGKTKTIAPGAAETLTIIVEQRVLTAYGVSAYLTVATDAHNAVNNILAARGFEADGDAALTYTWEQTMKIRIVPSQAANGTQLLTGRYNPADHPVTPMPTLGAENGLKLFDMIGIPFDDAKWQTLLDQLTFGDMVRLLADNYAVQLPIESVQAPGAGIRTMTEIGLPFVGLLAATFNAQLAEEVANAVGNTCLTEGIAILQGAEKTAYSEDSFLAETIFDAQTAGLEKKGVVTVVCPDAQEYVQDAILAGETLTGEWIPLAAWELSRWEQDPVIVSAMRSACHRNLYALANSCAMNGIGENTTVKTCLPWFILTCWIAAPVCLAAYIFFVIMWHRGKKKWKKTQEYLDYKTMKTTLREEKKK